MKRFLIITAVVLGAIACTKNEVNTIDAPDQEINFSVANYVAQTKANGAFLGDSFGVFAWYDSQDTNNPDEQGQTFMVNEKVVPNAPGWTVDGKTYFWPKTGNIDFFAYAPYDETASRAWVACTNTTHTLAGSATIAGTEDYLYSSMAMNYTKNDPQYKVSPTNQDGVQVSDGVPILFHHALAKVTVMFKASTLADADTKTTWKITVNSADFIDVVKDGTLVMPLASTSAGVQEWTLPTNSIWAPGSSKENLNAASNQELTTEAVSQTGKIIERTVLPQDLSTVSLKINYTIKAYNDGTLYSTETIEETKKLSEIFNAYWQMNKKYVYTVTISPSESIIYFDPAVADWED